MAFPASPYIDQTDGALRIAGTRVSLESVVVAFQAGESPERIVESFSTVTRAQAYGAIAYYLENQQQVDLYLAEVRQRFEESVRPLSEQAPELYARLEAARQQMNRKRA